MALVYTVQGPCTISISVEGGTPAVLGYSTNEDMFSLDVEKVINKVTSTAQGEEWAEAVFAGQIVTLAGVLSLWDPGVWAQYLGKVPGGTGYLTTTASTGLAGIIGKTFVQDSGTLEVTITPKITGATPKKKKITLPRCIPIPGSGSFSWRDTGNTNMKLAVGFIALRVGGAIGTLGDGNVGTQVMYTITDT